MPRLYLKTNDDLVEDVEMLRTPLTPEELATKPPKGVVNAPPRYYETRSKLAKGKKQATPAKDEAVRIALQMRIQGVKTKDVAEAFNVSEVTIRKWTREGIAKGMAEDIRNQIAEKLLPKAARTYEDILSTSASELSEHHKGHEVKLKAARDIAKGLGVLKPESQVTSRKTSVEMSYDDYVSMREARKANTNTVEGEVIESSASEQAHETVNE